MQLQSGCAEVDGTRLYYETAGDPSHHAGREALVFVHGFTLDTRMWDDQFEVFAQRYHVIRYDQRGFGKSDVPNAGTPYAPYDDLKALLEHLGIEQAHLVALSAGGGIALDFALMYPHMTRTLVLVDAVVGGWHFSDDWHTRMDHIWKTAQSDGILAAKRLWLAHPLFAPAHEQPIVSARLAQMVDDYSGWRFTHENTATAPQPRAFKRLEQIAAPTLVVVGERDIPDFHGMADALATRIPNARKVVLVGVGHMSNMEAPRTFNDTVLDWLETQT